MGAVGLSGSGFSPRIGGEGLASRGLLALVGPAEIVEGEVGP